MYGSRWAFQRLPFQRLQARCPRSANRFPAATSALDWATKLTETASLREDGAIKGATFRLAGTGVVDPAGYEGGTSSLPVAAAAAARGALSDAGWEADRIDVLVGACGVMAQAIPGTSILVQRELGLGGSGIPAFDVNATCLSALLALDLATMGFAAGRWCRALVATADRPSQVVDPADRHAGEMLRDGAAAFAIEAGGPHRVLATRFESYGEGADLATLSAGGPALLAAAETGDLWAASRFRMAGPAMFKAAARQFPRFLDRLLSEAGVDADAVDLVVPHQASAPALQQLRRVLGSRPERVVDIFAEHGNQVAASLPHALHVARQAGRLREGDIVLLVGTAAGLTFGGMVIRW